MIRWTRASWSGRWNSNQPHIWPANSWSKPGGAKVWARTSASTNSSTIQCCWSWPNRKSCSTTPCKSVCSCLYFLPCARVFCSVDHNQIRLNEWKSRLDFLRSIAFSNVGVLDELEKIWGIWCFGSGCLDVWDLDNKVFVGLTLEYDQKYNVAIV